jgi:hypothetical protein
MDVRLAVHPEGRTACTMHRCAAMTCDARAVRLQLAMQRASCLQCLKSGTAPSLARGCSLTRTAGPHARSASTYSSRSAKSAAATCDAGLSYRVTQAGHTLLLGQGPPLSAGGAPTSAPGAIASAAIAIGAAAAARCSARRPRRQRMPPVSCRGRTDYALTVLTGPYRAPVGGPVLGSAWNLAGHGPPFDASGHLNRQLFRLAVQVACRKCC